MIYDFIKGYCTADELKKIDAIVEEMKTLNEKYNALKKDQGDLVEKFNGLQDAPLEIGETEQERHDRIEELRQVILENSDQLAILAQNITSRDLKVTGIRSRAASEYYKRDLKDIMKDCLEIVNAVEPGDIMDIEIARKKTDITPSEFNKFSYVIYFYVIKGYINVFVEKPDSLFKILNCIYERTCHFYPSGLTTSDKKSKYCIFDENFFKALKRVQEGQETKQFELELLANTKIEQNHKILPSTAKFTATMTALSIVSESHQMTIDEYLSSQTVNNLVTFEGLDDSKDGLKIVFNKNVASKDDIVVTFKNLEDASGGGIAPSKVFAMVLEKMNDLGYFHHPHVNEAVTVSTKDLIEHADYANYKAAQRALEQARSTLEEILVNFSNKKGMNVNTPWFSSVGWKDKGTLLLNPSKDINWRLVGCHFAIYPIYIYKLKTHAFRLAYYIFTQARINKETNSKGDIEFKLSLTNIAERLGLPDAKIIKKDFKKLIFDKIVAAMKEIIDADKEYYKDNSMLALKLDINKNLTAKEIILTGNLKVTIKKGDITEAYTKIRDAKTDVIEAAKRKKKMNERKAAEKK